MITPQYVEILHDRLSWRLESGELVKNSRHEDPRFNKNYSATYPYPGVREHTARPQGGTNTLRLNAKWRTYIFGPGGINSAAGSKAARRNNAGYINPTENPEWPGGSIVPLDSFPIPKVEAITSIGARHRVVLRANGAVRIAAFCLQDDPPDPKLVNPKTHPWMFAQMRSIAIDGSIGNAPDGEVFYMPILVKDRDGEAWLSESLVEYVDTPTPKSSNAEENMIKVPGFAKGWARGLDLSSHNGAFDASVAPPDFVLQRISYADGVGVFPDARLEPLYAELASVPVLGGWHFWSGYQDTDRQIAEYLNGVNNKRHSSHWLDWEIRNKKGVVVNPETKPSAEGARRWIEAVAKATGQEAGLYIQRSDYQKLLAMGQTWVKNVPIWIKYWILEPYLETASFAAICNSYPVEQSRARFLQYGGDAGGVEGFGDGAYYGTASASVDVDVYNGTVEELKARYGVVTNPQPEPDPELSDHERILRLEGWARQNGAPF